VDADDGNHTGSSSSISVTVGTVCQIKLRDTANNGGGEVAASVIDLNVDSATASDEFTVFAAGYDRYTNFAADQTVVWSGDAIAHPWPQTNTVTDDSCRVFGVKIGAGTLQADFSGGGGDKTDTVAVTVNPANTTAAWTTANTDSGGSSFLGSNTTQAAQFWNPRGDAVTAWMDVGGLSWNLEAFVVNDRGSRATFPDNVFLVGNANGLDIVDATNNQLFMRFNAGAGRVIDSNFGVITSVGGLNGKVYVALRNAAVDGSLIVIDFVNDNVRRYSSSGEFSWNGGTIDQRNTGSTWNLDDAAATKQTNSDPLYALVAKRIGAVDYVILGTQDSVDVFQDSAGTVSIYNDPTVNAVVAVDLSSDSRVYYGEDATGVHRFDAALPLAADFAASRTYTESTAAEIASLFTNAVAVGEGSSEAQGGSHSLLVGTDFGLSVIQEHSTFGSSTSKSYNVAGSGSNPFAGGLCLDGTNGYVSAPNAGTALTDVGTVELWIMPRVTLNSGSGAMFLHKKGDPTVDGSYGIEFNNSADGRIEFYVRHASSTFTLSTTATSWTQGTWYHLAATFDGVNGIDMWTDGNDHQFNGVDLSTGFTASTDTLNLGGDGVSGYFQGSLDEFRLSDNIRYAGASFVVPGAAFVDDGNTMYLYHFDELSGTTAAFSDSDAMQNATLNASAWFCAPLMAGTSPIVTSLKANVQAGPTATGEIGTSGAGGAWSELTGLHTSGAAALSDSATGLDVIEIFQYHVDGAADSDIGIGIGTGFNLLRR